ncbi:DUF4286 family protein [Amycolatopsis sp. GM8]|uniref:DUF4286 family protein n=1 Tax=Amycolatopsis sp. GM8 TaxID=2896530 RepID=UPI001F1E3ABE|nr:DUF4286 family protein [Amycolatopsis sp. GM8]
MSTAMFLAWTSPVSVEAEDEFNEWYTNTHVPQVREHVPGITDVQRYTVLGSGGESGPRRYVCCYMLEGSDPAAAATALAAASKNGLLDMTPAMDMTGMAPEVHFLTPVE